MFDIDNTELELECPQCGFVNPFLIRQARLCDTMICRGCHVNIRLDDQMNTVRKARASAARAVGELQRAIESINLRIRF